MATTTVEEFISKINELGDTDRAELLRRLNESTRKSSESKKTKTNGKKGYVHPNTIWIKENKSRYAGNYVALKDGELIAFGKTIKEADQASKAMGVSDPLLHYILPTDYVPWGGW